MRIWTGELGLLPCLQVFLQLLPGATWVTEGEFIADLDRVQGIIWGVDSGGQRFGNAIRECGLARTVRGGGCRFSRISELNGGKTGFDSIEVAAKLEDEFAVAAAQKIYYFLFTMGATVLFDPA